MILGDTATFNWSANVGPCVATGGSNGDGWAGPQPMTGSVSLTVTQIGVTQYALTCGTGPRTATGFAYIDGVAPGTIITADVTQVAAGTSFWLSWSGLGIGGACAASGGSSTDNWATG